jgi:hypothetical protein
MASEVSTLISHGRFNEVWQRFCGFLDLTLAEFMAMQERLLREQLQVVGDSGLGRALMGGHIPASVDEFRRQVRLTTYEDYEPYLKDQREDMLAEKPVAWAHTSGRSGQYKWAPYSARQFKLLGEGVLTAFILSNARARGDVGIRPGDTLVYNAPSRPYTSGHALVSLAELFDFRFLPPAEKTEEMSFEQRIASSFRMALRDGIDQVGSISSVLMRVAQGFASGASSSGFSTQMLHPRVLTRLGRGMIRSKWEHRPMLPSDLWRVKGMLVGGTDTDIYRARLQKYWGCPPHELYACTEAPNILATGIWTHREMYFLPHVCFYEFIPEEEWAETRRTPNYTPSTVLLDQVKVGQRYEVVLTNFYGGAFLRYRTRDLIRFVSLSDEKHGMKLPAMIFDGRDSDIIDLAGFTGMIDEGLMWHAIEDAGLLYEEWFVRKEVMGDGHAGLHLYIELREPAADKVVAERVNAQLARQNRFYGDLANMLGYAPIRVTQVPAGVFKEFTLRQREKGADLSHWKPRHMNPAETVVRDVLTIAEERK